MDITGRYSPRRKRRGSVSTFGYDNPYDPVVSKSIISRKVTGGRLASVRRKIEEKYLNPTGVSDTKKSTALPFQKLSSLNEVPPNPSRVSSFKTSQGGRKRRNGSLRNSRTPTDSNELDSVADDDDDNVPSNLPFRIRLKKYLAVSNTGIAFDVLNAMLSIVACVLYVYETYLDTNSPIKQDLNVADVMLFGFFLFDYLLRCFLADNTWQYMRSLSAVIDLFTILPSLYSFLGVQDLVDSQGNTSQHFDIEILRLLRILRIVRIHRMFTYIDSEVTLRFAQLALTVVSATVFMAGLLHSLEKNALNGLVFHDELYFIITTVSTVGYGEFAPVTAMGRLAVCIFILASLIYVPRMHNTLMTAVGQNYTSQRVKGPKAVGHILVLGELNAIGARDFFIEMFHEDHGAQDLNIVVLTESDPGPELTQVLKEPLFETVVTHIRGSPLIDKDLARVAAHNASACFVLTDKHCSNSDQADSASILRALAVKRYVMRETGESIRVCIQLIRPENKEHVPSPIQDGRQSQLVPDPIVCIDEIKMTMLAKNVLCPGIAALVGNLITTSVEMVCSSGEEERKDIADEEDESEVAVGSNRNVKKKSKRKIMQLKSQTSTAAKIFSSSSSQLLAEDVPNWFQEYTRGTGFEIYRTEIPPKAQGLKFAEFAKITYIELGVLLFALEVGLQSNAVLPQLYLNPGNFIIPNLEKFKVHCFVIAPDYASANLREIAAASSSEKKSFHVHANGSTGNYSVAITLAKAVQAEETKKHQNEQSQADTTVLPKRAQKWRQMKTDRIQQNLIDPLQSSGGGGVHYKAIESALACQMKDAYHVFKFPIELKNATVNLILDYEFPQVHSHILVTGATSNLYYLIKTLRAKYISPNLRDLIPIVILNPNPPSESDWKKLARFPGVFYLKGSALEDTDLVRAGVHYARAAIILAKPTMERRSSLETLADANAIFIYQRVKAMNSKIQIITELVNYSNVELLDLDSLLLGDLEAMNGDYHFLPAYASGGVYTSSMLDTLICQAYFNPQITDVIQKLVAGDTQETTTIADKYNLDVKGSNLIQLEVPKQFTFERYEKLFIHFVSQHNILPMGLFRKVGTNPVAVSLGRLCALSCGDVPELNGFILRRRHNNPVLYS